VDYQSHAVALDRNELGALLVAAGFGPRLQHALISLLALNGLRVSEATGADIEQLGLDRGHRLPAPPGGDRGQAELAQRPIPAAEADGRRCSH
jgi:integrase